MSVDARKLMEEPEEEVPMEKAPKSNKYHIGLMFVDDSMAETEAFSWRGVLNYLRDLPDTVPVSTVVVHLQEDE